MRLLPRRTKMSKISSDVSLLRWKILKVVAVEAKRRSVLSCDSEIQAAEK